MKRARRGKLGGTGAVVQGDTGASPPTPNVKIKPNLHRATQGMVCGYGLGFVEQGRIGMP